MMTPEKIAEWRKFALEAIPQLSQLSDESERERIIISTCATAILELIDALTVERERAEKATVAALINDGDSDREKLNRFLEESI